MRIVEFDDITLGNIRELGDYQTADGRKIKPNLIYRGVTTNFITNPKDLEKFKSLNIRYIVDLRSKVEVEKRPDIVFENVESIRVCGMVHKGVEIDFSPDNFAYLTEDLKKMGEYYQEPMLYLYKSFPFDNDAIRQVFKMLVEGKAPIYIHCTAGKDRTGLLCALILIALGVDEKVAKDDYMYTNIARKEFIEKRILEAETIEEKQRITKVFSVHEILFDETFNELKRRYPDWKEYFKKEAGLNENDFETLKDLYLK